MNVHSHTYFAEIVKPFRSCDQEMLQCGTRAVDHFFLQAIDCPTVVDRLCLPRGFFVAKGASGRRTRRPVTLFSTESAATKGGAGKAGVIRPRSPNIAPDLLSRSLAPQEVVRR
jgi:hypothetical protein